MRTIYVILLGLILFQGVFIAFAEVFPYAESIDINNPLTDENLADYHPAQVEETWTNTSDGLLIGGGIGGFIGAIGFIGFVLSKNYPAAGLCLFIGIIIGLLVAAWHTVSSVNVTGNVIITAIVDLLFLVIGLLSLFAVVDMFAPQGAQQ